MKTSTIVGVAVAVVVAGGAWYWLNGTGQSAVPAPTFVINGQPVTLVDGRAETPAAPGSAEKVVTQYFGNAATGDLNGDGLPDVAFLLTQTTGGSGTFYYVAATLVAADGSYRGTDAVLLGDRIAPQTTEIRNGQLIVNYAERAPGEPMTAQPSIGKSLYLKLDPATLQFGEVVQNFEGEANPSVMTLGMQTWTWVKTLYGDGTSVAPKKAQAFTLTFKPDGTFSATTDCNGAGGEYAAKDGKITFSKMASTLMYCDGSQETDFTNMLQESQGYLFTSKGELVFDLKFDSGTMTFR